MVVVCLSKEARHHGASHPVYVVIRVIIPISFSLQF
jgi:hypothetical protein